MRNDRADNVNQMIGSESGHFGETKNPDYASSKAGVQYGLLRSLMASVPRVIDGARVNAVAPGAVDTIKFKEECDANAEQLWVDAEAT